MIRLLVNPAARGGRAAAVAARLAPRAAELDVEIVRTRDPEDLTRRAAAAVHDGAERLVILGGDGTVHQALPALAGTSCALGIVPAGRGDDLAGALGLPADPEAALHRAVRGPVRSVDLGRAGGRWFAGTAGVGFDGAVAEHVRSHTGAARGPLVYPRAALRMLLRFTPPDVEILHDGGAYRGPVLFALLANSPRFGGGMRIAPSARLDDGRLDLVVVRPVPILTLLRIFPRVYRGTHVGHPSVTTARTRRARIRSPGPVPLYGDGEPMGVAGPDGVEVEVIPGALRVTG